jgi:hypothetical protein
MAKCVRVNGSSLPRAIALRCYFFKLDFRCGDCGSVPDCTRITPGQERFMRIYLMTVVVADRGLP